MAPVEQLLPDHQEPCEDRRKEYETLMSALSELPNETHQRILADIAMTSRRCEESLDFGPLRHITSSLYATALLHRKPDYLAALAQADEAEAVGPPSDEIDVAGLMDRVRAGR